jgi:multiple sugar transport system permease protein
MILACFMIPVPALIVNHFVLMAQFKLINTYLGVILPQLVYGPVTVIIYKQFFDSVPKEFREAAKIDGAPEWEIFLRVYLPLNWGITAALAIIIFIGAWNAFLWPFLAVTKPELMNVTVGATQLGSWGIDGLAAALLTGLPIAIVYLLFQRKVSEAMMLSAGIKG